MGFENDCILNIQSLAGEYFCAVCRTLVYPNEAIQAPCTHLYCKPCLSYVVSTTHACPYDGYRVTEADSKPLLESNKTLADTIGQIQVHCLYYRTGCTWQGSLTDSTTHCSTCAFGESAVLCNRCGIQLKHRQVQEHAQNCTGAQTQVQQPGGTQDTTAAGSAAALDQTQAGAQASQAQASQAQASQAQALTSVVSNQDSSQAANLATQSQVAQVATPTPEQLYQQQQQYQQYYQQYPGYDPYQQNYQYYYQQYPQAAQQYPQAYGQPQPQGYGQVPAQPMVQAQHQVQVQPQVPSQGAQLPLQSQSQPAANPQAQVPYGSQAVPQMPAQSQAQPQIPAQGQAQPQIPAPGQAPLPHAHPYNQPPPYAQPQPQVQAQPQPYTQPQPQPYTQPQPQAYAQPQPVPQQQYPLTHPPMQHPHTQTYPQPQTQQHYLQPQPQVQSQPNLQAHGHPPQHPPPTSAQTPNAVTGYQSFPQAPAGAGHPMQVAGAQYPNQMPGQFPSQTAQMRPPQSYPNVPNQQQPAMLSSQGQGQGQGQGQPFNGPSAQQLPVYPNNQQPGYPSQQRPSVQAAQQGAPQQYAQQQSYPGQGPYMQHQPPQMPPQSQQNYGQPPSAQPNVAHNYAGRPMGAQTVAHPYAQATGFAGGAPQVRPSQLNQNHPVKANSQQPSAEKQTTQSQRVSGGERPQDSNMEKGVHGQNGPSKDARDMAMASNAGQRVDDMKSKANNGVAAIADGNSSKSYFSGSSTDNAVDNHAQEAPRTKGNQGESFTELPSTDASKSGVEDHRDGQELKHTTSNVAEGSDAKSLPKSQPKPQSLPHGPATQHKPGAASISHTMTHPVNSQQPAFQGHPSTQVRPQGPGQAPNNMNHHQGNLPPHQAGQLQKPPVDPLAGSTYMGHRPGASRHEIEKFAAQRSGHFDNRQPDSHPHGPVEGSTFGPGPHGIRPGAMAFGGPSAHESMLAPGMRDERGMPIVEEHLKPFPHREFDDDSRKFPRPPQLEAGPSNYGARFPSSGPLDRGSRMFGGDGMLRSFDNELHGLNRDPAFKLEGGGSGPSRLLPPFHLKDAGERPHAFLDDDMRRADFRRTDLPGPPPGPGFGRPHMDGLLPKSPGRDYPGFPSRTFGPYGDVGGNDSRSFEGSKPFNFPAEPFGKPQHESRFPVPPRGDLDIRGNFRVGEHLGQNQELIPGHLRRGGHMGFRGLPEFGRPGELSLMDPLAGNFPPRDPFGDSFGGEKTGLPRTGEHAFRGGFGFPHHVHDGGFHPREMDSFDNLRKRKPGSIMCRICKVECGTVEGLDLHSQSRDHQRKARDMVLSIKQQNKKKHKVSKDQASVEEGRDGGRPKNMGFQGRGNKR